MTLAFNIASGTSDALPRRHFIPHHLRLKSRSESLTHDDDGAEHPASYPVYKPILEFNHTLRKEFPFNSRIIDSGKLVWFSVSEKELVKLNTMFYRDNELRIGKSWAIEKLCSKTSYREQCLSTMVSFSPDLEFGLLFQHIRYTGVIFKPTHTKIRISVLKFTNDKEYKIHRNIHTIKQPNNISHYVFCLSPKQKYLAFAVVPSCRDYTELELYQIEYRGENDKYSLKHVSRFKINYYINSMKFNEAENTLLLLGNKCFYVIHPLDTPEPSETKFFGCDPYIVYDHKLDTEFIFSQSKDNLYEVDIFEVKPPPVPGNWNSGNLLFDYKKIRNLQYDDLRSTCGVKRVFYVHHHKDVTRLFLGFTREVYVFNPFSCQCIYKLDLSCDHAAPFCYTLDANWSGKEVSIFCWDNLDFASLKIYHLEEEFDMSLQKQALLSVQANYPFNVLREMNLPKTVRLMLGLV